MDATSLPPDYVLQHFLMVAQGFLPGPVLLFVDDHVLNPDSFIQNAFASVWTFVTAMWELFEPLLEPLRDSIANFLNTSPNIFGAAVILVIAYLLLKVVFFVQRTMLFFTRLVFKALWWAFVAALVSMAFQRGIGETAKDVADIVGKIVSGVLTVVDIWMTQYMAATNTANARNQPSFKVQGGGS